MQVKVKDYSGGTEISRDSIPITRIFSIRKNGYSVVYELLR